MQGSCSEFVPKGAWEFDGVRECEIPSLIKLQGTSFGTSSLRIKFCDVRAGNMDYGGGGGTSCAVHETCDAAKGEICVEGKCGVSKYCFDAPNQEQCNLVFPDLGGSGAPACRHAHTEVVFMPPAGHGTCKRRKNDT